MRYIGFPVLVVGTVACVVVTVPTRLLVGVTVMSARLHEGVPLVDAHSPYEYVEERVLGRTLRLHYQSSEHTVTAQFKHWIYGLGGRHRKTRVTRIPSSSSLVAGGPCRPTFFDRMEADCAVSAMNDGNRIGECWTETLRHLILTLNVRPSVRRCCPATPFAKAMRVEPHPQCLARLRNGQLRIPGSRHIHAPQVG